MTRNSIRILNSKAVDQFSWWERKIEYYSQEADNNFFKYLPETNEWSILPPMLEGHYPELVELGHWVSTSMLVEKCHLVTIKKTIYQLNDTISIAIHGRYVNYYLTYIHVGDTSAVAIQGYILVVGFHHTGSAFWNRVSSGNLYYMYNSAMDKWYSVPETTNSSFETNRLVVYKDVMLCC